MEAVGTDVVGKKSHAPWLRAIDGGAGRATIDGRPEVDPGGATAALPSATPKISVVVPTLNESANLPIVFGHLPHGLHEVIVVDGRSTDDTVEVAQRLRPDVRIVLEARKGKGAALRAGFEAATGEIIVMLDADGSADPAEIVDYVAALTSGADFAKGSRFLPGGGSSDITPLRRAGNAVLCWVTNRMWGARYSDLCYGYNAFWAHCLPVMDVDCDGFEVETLINIRIAEAGLRVTEVPSFEYDRIHGESNLNAFRDGLRILRTMITERFTRRAARTDAATTSVASRSGEDVDLDEEVIDLRDGVVGLRGAAPAPRVAEHRSLAHRR